MANATGTPQSALYQARGVSDGNQYRNRSAEQQHSYNSGNPMNYLQFMNGQDPSLSRYTPPTLNSMSPTNPTWTNNNYQGGYAYNLPTSFGGFGGFSQFSQNPQVGSQAPDPFAAQAAASQGQGGGSFGAGNPGNTSMWSLLSNSIKPQQYGGPMPSTPPPQPAQDTARQNPMSKPMQMPPMMPPTRPPMMSSAVMRPENENKLPSKPGLSYNDLINLLRGGGSTTPYSPPAGYM